MTQFELDTFLDYKLSFLFESPFIPVNKLFELFLVTFAEIVEQFAPKRKATRREKDFGLNVGYQEIYLNQFKQKTGYSRKCKKRFSSKK